MRFSNQQGILSLMTSVIISLLLLAVTTSMTVLMIGEQRQATDIDQSIRAYYAAEAGVEDALLQLKQDPNFTKPECGDSEPLDGPGLAYTCLTVKNTTQALVDDLNLEEPLQIELPAGLDRLEVSWGKYTDDALNNIPSSPVDFPSKWTWPAIMEATLISYPASATFSPEQIGIVTAVLKPHATDLNNALLSNLDKPELAQCQVTSTSPPRPYNCVETIVNFDSGRRYILRLRPRLPGANPNLPPPAIDYQVRVLNGSGQAMDIPDQSATIDVTARAGDVFRRVVTKVPIKAGVLQGLDYVLFADQDICKDFRVGRDEDGEETKFREFCAL